MKKTSLKLIITMRKPGRIGGKGVKFSQEFWAKFCKHSGENLCKLGKSFSKKVLQI